MNRSGDPLVIKIGVFLAWVAGLLLLVSAVLITVDVATRSLVNLAFLESFELSSYAFAAAVTLGLAYTLTCRAHIRIEVVYMLLKGPLRLALDLVAIALLAVVALALAWFAAQAVLSTYEMSAHSNTSLGVPLVLPQGLWLAGLIWFALTAVWLTVRSAVHLFMGQSDQVKRDIGMLALQEEIKEIEEIRLSTRALDGAPAKPRT